MASFLAHLFQYSTPCIVSDLFSSRPILFVERGQDSHHYCRSNRPTGLHRPLRYPLTVAANATSFTVEATRGSYQRGSRHICLVGESPSDSEQSVEPTAHAFQRIRVGVQHKLLTSGYRHQLNVSSIGELPARESLMSRKRR